VVEAALGKASENRWYQTITRPSAIDPGASYAIKFGDYEPG
jgi:hypothetical protein